MASVHDKLGRVRPPRVHIRMDIETEGAEVVKSLPFVVGVMGDFSGNPSTPLPALSDPKRRFIQIDRDNFDRVMAQISPELNLRVKNALADDGTEFGVQLKFRSMKDFEPGRIVEQVEPLKKLLARRNELKELISKVDLSGPDAENRIEQLLKAAEAERQSVAAAGQKPEETK